MKPSHWNFLRFDPDSIAFYPLPAFFFFVVDSHTFYRREYKNWGFGVHFLFWTLEWWRYPIPY